MTAGPVFLSFAGAPRSGLGGGENFAGTNLGAMSLGAIKKMSGRNCLEPVCALLPKHTKSFDDDDDDDDGDDDDVSLKRSFKF